MIDSLQQMTSIKTSKLYQEEKLAKMCLIGNFSMSGLEFGVIEKVTKHMKN